MFINKCHLYIQQTFNECLLCARKVPLTPELSDNCGVVPELAGRKYTQGHITCVVMRHFAFGFS